MATAVDVMKYMKSQMNLNGEVQLQKLAYYAQAWSLAWDGRPLFQDQIQAWKMGPVVPALRFRRDAADENALNEAEKAVVDAVLGFYGKYHGNALVDLTHNEDPWVTTWDGTERCNQEITHDTMRRYYTRRMLTGEEGPVRTTNYQVADDEEIMQIVDANEVRWRETLEILSK